MGKLLRASQADDRETPHILLPAVLWFGQAQAGAQAVGVQTVRSHQAQGFKKETEQYQAGSCHLPLI